MDINNAIEKERRILEITYFDKADIYRNAEVTVGNISRTERKKVLENIKCSLSKKRNIVANMENINTLEGDYVLFCTEEIIKGDEIHLTTLNGRKYNLLAGLPNDCISHYETPVKIRERA